MTAVRYLGYVTLHCDLHVWLFNPERLSGISSNVFEQEPSVREPVPISNGFLSIFSPQFCR